MIKKLYENLLNGIDVRQTLIDLKKLLKEHQNQDEFLNYLNYNYDLFRKILENEDAKVRKNIATIIGLLELYDMTLDLIESYEFEEILFVKSAYLKALQNLDCEEYINRLKGHQKKLLNIEINEENQKHINEEIREITNLIELYQRDEDKNHKFIGYNEKSKIILTTNRQHQDITLKQLKEKDAKKIAGGVLLVTEDLKSILKIRTFEEILFDLDLKDMDFDENEISQKIVNNVNLVGFLRKRHLENNNAYKFRIEIRGKINQDVKVNLVKKIATKLEVLSSHRLINSISNYEIEIRLILNKNNKLNLYLKLYTIEDNRFLYRKNFLPTSIKSMTSATMMELARPYFKDNAQIIDPFSGTATMLIERNIIKPAHPIYAIEIYQKAIDFARENAKISGTKINFINRDFNDFKHQYLFDEIITNMPRVTEKKNEKEIFLLYKMFCKRMTEILKPDGKAFVYSTEPRMFEECIKNTNINILQKYEIYKKENSYFYILEIKK